MRWVEAGAALPSAVKPRTRRLVGYLGAAAVGVSGYLPWVRYGGEYSVGLSHPTPPTIAFLGAYLGVLVVAATRGAVHPRHLRRSGLLVAAGATAFALSKTRCPGDAPGIGPVVAAAGALAVAAAGRRTDGRPLRSR